MFLLVAAVGLLPAPPLLPRAPLASTRRAAFVRATEIPFDVHFLRAAKSALRRSLEDEGGLLTEDALETIGVLSDVNPSAPDPSADYDLWSGTWEFHIASLVSGPLEQRGRGSVVVDESGELELHCSLALGATGAPASLRVTGRVSAVADAVLELQCAQVVLSLEGQDETLVSACAQATGLELEPWADEWIGAQPLPALRLAQLYLDQDCHVVRLSEDAAEQGQGQRDPVVLFKYSS